MTDTERIAELEAQLAYAKAKLVDAERELKRALYPPTFSELAELKQALDPLRVSATETLDNIARRVIRDAKNMRAERDEMIAKRSIQIARAEAAEARLAEQAQGTAKARAMAHAADEDADEARLGRERAEKHIKELEAKLAEAERERDDALGRVASTANRAVAEQDAALARVYALISPITTSGGGAVPMVERLVALYRAAEAREKALREPALAIISLLELELPFDHFDGGEVNASCPALDGGECNCGAQARTFECGEAIARLRAALAAGGAARGGGDKT